jgi:3-deoxy-manno-octulosonate cytidylyltransferase (CMP-KDO synthetase)
MVNVQTAKIIAVIPARFASTRFPGKPLAMIQGQTMISRVFEQVSKSRLVQEVIVATDDERIYEHVKEFGANVVMTGSHHPSGTDRCAEVAGLFPAAEIILNVQGDEPYIQPEQIDLLTATLLAKPGHQIATLAKRITAFEALLNHNVVKVVTSTLGEALYFSRHPIPFIRGQAPENWLQLHDFYKHIGLYAFRQETLRSIACLPPSPLEKAESLEQLRWLEYGLRIAVGFTELETIGVDVPEDLLRLDGGRRTADV